VFCVYICMYIYMMYVVYMMIAFIGFIVERFVLFALEFNFRPFVLVSALEETP